MAKRKKSKKRSASKKKLTKKPAAKKTKKRDGPSLTEWIRAAIKKKPELKANDVIDAAKKAFPSSKTVKTGFPQMLSMIRLRMMREGEIAYAPRRPLSSSERWKGTKFAGTGGKPKSEGKSGKKKSAKKRLKKVAAKKTKKKSARRAA